MKARIETAFSTLDPMGRVAAECWSAYKLKLEAWYAHRADFEEALRDWPEIETKLRSLVKRPEGASHILHAIALPIHFEGLKPAPTHAEVQFAIKNAPPT
ncbi:MAG: hypothetical protein ACXW4E_02120 [Anaerolineales bacterium]